MARKAMVTRTISFTECKVMVVYTDTMQVKNEIYTYTGANKEDDKILKDLQKTIEADNVKLVQIMSKEEKSQLYGMYEEDFIKYAVKMDGRFDKIG